MKFDFRLRAGRLLLACFFVSVLLSVPVIHAQAAAAVGMETATQDRLEDPGWWPTKGNAPRSSFAGNAACQQCHAGLFRSQIVTPMANAAHLAVDSKLLHQHTTLTIDNGPYSYRLVSNDSGAVLSAASGGESEAAPLLWAFGSGELGQTFLYQQEGKWFESRVSFYTKPGQIDITTGHGRAAPESVHDALGRGMKDMDAQRCFGCHTGLSTSAGRFEPQSALPGITCEACHGPGAEHAKAMASSNAAAKETKILNPARLNAVDSVDFCGACHRTWADVAFSGVSKRDADVVRFQPYRLEKSRCWGKAGDARLTCVACHDPHVPLERNAASYDAQCLSCHLRHGEAPTTDKSGAACPRGADHCTNCHMPRVAVPEMHGEFTDHFIRIVSRDEALKK